MAVISNLIARLRADTASFDRKMNKSRREMQTFSKGVKTMGRQMLAIAGVGGGIYAVQRGLKSIIKAASDAQETQAKFNTVFKNLSKQANTWAESFGKSVGRSNQSVKSWMAGLQDTFVPLGIARDEAMRLSQSLVTLAVDVASFNNKADPDVIRDFTSALIGNHETVRKYGIIISESAIKQAALRDGLKKTYAQLTDLEKVQLRYKLILEGTSDAQGDAFRTADSYANQVKRLYANIDDLKVSMGKELLPVFTDFVKLVNDNEKSLVDFSKAILAPIKSILYLINIVNALDEIQKTRPLPSSQPYGRWYPVPLPIPSAAPTVPSAQVVPAAQSKEAYDWGALSKRLDDTNKATAARKKLIQDNVAAIRAKYIPAIQMEIELTGKLSGARAHARQMMKMENDLRAEALYKTEYGLALMKEQKTMLKELEGAQRLARIADSIGDAFGRAFERSIFEAEKLRDVMKALMRDIAMAVVRQSIIEPWARGISGAISGYFGKGGGELSGEFPTTSHGVPYNPNLQHGGTVLETGWAKVHKGETFSGVQGGGALTVNLNNTGQERLEVTEAEFDFRQMVLNITMEAAQTDGPYRRSIASIKKR